MLAGPGTGKSFSLKETIKHQVAGGQSISDFYAMTLTKAAAGKFEEEAREEIAEDFRAVSTVHFRAKGIVHKYADSVELPKSFGVLSSAELEQVLVDIQQDFNSQGSTLGKKAMKALLAKYQQAAANLKASDDGFARSFVFYRHFYKALEWYDVVSLACHILERNRKARAAESNAFPFLLVDEYQDLNRAEQVFINLLSGGRPTLLAVGDDDQSIYGGTMRYADTSGILKFCELYPTAKKIVLPVCSRCPSRILKAAYSLIAKNLARDTSKQQLLSMPEEDERTRRGLVAAISLKSEKQEAVFLAAGLGVLRSAGVPAREILVLCANRELGKELFVRIQEQDGGLPLDNLLGKEDTVGGGEQIVTYLKRFLADYNDNLALRMLFSSLCNLADATISLVRTAAIKSRTSLWSTLIRDGDRTDSVVSDKGKLSLFCKAVAESEGQDLLTRLKIFAGIYPSLRGAVAAVEADEVQGEGALDEERTEIQKPATGIRFMTMHGSKGLEARYVFIPFMEDEVTLPGKDLEEQRRVLYVAITRARTACVLTWAWSRRSRARYRVGGGPATGRHRHRFLIECGLHHHQREEAVLEEIGKLAQHEEAWLRAQKCESMPLESP
ncbi:MAG: ATP-dependent helicase [Phycisphaerae bacterium]|nr:ATP-dependent helicase [Phycisphaerae bacterium]